MAEPRLVELLAVLDQLDGAHGAWRQGSPGWSDRAIEAMETLPQLTAALRAVHGLADEYQQRSENRRIYTVWERTTYACVADDLRAVLAALTPDTTTEKASTQA